MRHCQVQVLPEATGPIPAHERWRRAAAKARRYLRTGTAKALADPGVLWRKARDLVLGPPYSGRPAGPGAARLPALGLRPGERVRVRALEEIRRTLDGHGRYDRLAFMPAVMAPFCGRVFPVRKRVQLFFDERRQRLCRLRDVVILEGVYCEPALDIREDWGGCDRTCFLFWKEAWLERAGD